MTTPTRRPGRRVGSRRDGLLIARIAGFPVYLAPSWLIIAALITVSYGRVATDAVPGLGRTGGHVVAFVFAALFAASILAHEVGHALVAQALGLRVRKVVIFLLGGVSEIDEAQRPRDEFLVAAAGPAVSLGIAAAAWAAHPGADTDTVTGVLLWLLLWSNLSVAAFNVLPGLPLDGGRVLRAAVWGATGARSSATAVAAWGGRILAVAVLAGALALQGEVLGGPLLLATSVVLACFLWFSAGASLRRSRVEARVAALQIATLTSSAVWVPAGTPLAEAIAAARRQHADAVVVLDAVGTPQAIVDDERIARLPQAHWPMIDVREVAELIAPGAVLADSLAGEALVAALRATPAHSYLVVGRWGEPVGIVRSRDIARALSD